MKVAQNYVWLISETLLTPDWDFYGGKMLQRWLKKEKVEKFPETSTVSRVKEHPIMQPRSQYEDSRKKTVSDVQSHIWLLEMEANGSSDDPKTVWFYSQQDKTSSCFSSSPLGRTIKAFSVGTFQRAGMSRMLTRKQQHGNVIFEFCCGPVTGFLPAGTEALWRWSSPPESSAGTQRWASPPPLSSSRSASDREATRDSPPGTASGSRGPPGPTPPGSPSLKDEADVARLHKNRVTFERPTAEEGKDPTWIRNSAFGGQFSQQDSEWPDVWLNGEAAVERRLRGRPLDGKLCSCGKIIFKMYEIEKVIINLLKK